MKQPGSIPMWVRLTRCAVVLPHLIWVGCGGEVRAQEPPEFKLVLPATELLSALPRIDRQIVGALGVDSIRALFGGDMGQSPNLRPFTSLLRAGDVEGSYLVDMEDVEVTTLFLGLSEVQGAVPRDVSLHWEAGLVDFGPRTYRRLYVTAKDALATGEMPEDFATQHVGDLIAVVIDGEVVRTLLIGCPKSLFVYPCIAEFDVSRPLGVGPSVRGQSAIPTQLNVSSEWSLFMVASEKD